LEVDKWADEQGLDICGFYHSHPDHPSSPSEYDRKLAWEAYLYLIISIRSAIFHDARAWIYDSDEACFTEAQFKPHAFPLSSHPTQELAGAAMPNKNIRP
jgi:proteasome lid subunit RPN8/RPN11